MSLKIFEVGLRSFGDNLEFVRHYLDHLIKVNEDSSMSVVAIYLCKIVVLVVHNSHSHSDARALFEKTLSTISGTEAKPIWDQFLDFETEYGDLASVQKLEKRREAQFPEGSRRAITTSSYLSSHSCLTTCRTPHHRHRQQAILLQVPHLCPSPGAWYER